MNAFTNPAAGSSIEDTVATTTTAAQLAEDFGAPPATVILWALKSAYAHLDDCMAQMDSVTASQRPDMPSLSSARFKISQASLARRQLLHNACDHLLGVVTPKEAETVRSLQRQSVAYGAASTEHIRTWPASAVQKDWNAYREASRRIRAKMKQAMRTEQRLLFPLLARYQLS